jgi:hypothetical protein
MIWLEFRVHVVIAKEKKKKKKRVFENKNAGRLCLYSYLRNNPCIYTIYILCCLCYINVKNKYGKSIV